MKPKNKFSFLGAAAFLSIASTLSVKAADPKDFPVLVRTVQPVVPWAFAREGSSGVVNVTFTVDEKGAVRDPVVAATTDDKLKRSVLLAISQWKFNPAYRNGAAVPMQVTVPVKFGKSG